MKSRITELRIGQPEVFVGRYWVEVEYKLDGVLHIDQISGVTEHEVTRKAKDRANGLLGKTSRRK